MHTFSIANAPQLLRNLSICAKPSDFHITREGDKWSTSEEILSEPLEEDRKKGSTPSRFYDAEKADVAEV